MNKAFFVVGIIALIPSHTYAQQTTQTKEIWEPVPATVTPAKVNSDAPSDAIVLFDGKNLNQWVSAKDSSSAVAWPIAKGAFTVNKVSGDIQTKESFQDYQLHIEWMVPGNISGSDQSRGNSGIFLASFNSDNGRKGYELQILDSYNNKTYVNGQAGSIYRLHAPLVNPIRPPGSWNCYDIIWVAPRFNEEGALKTPGYATVLFNSVAVQINAEVKGTTGATSVQIAHGPSPIRLQAHNDKSAPISYRNIWIRRL